MIMVAIFGSLSFVSEANANSRQHGYRSVDRHHHRQYAPVRHHRQYAPVRHHRQYAPVQRPHHYYNSHKRNNWAPYVAGALALGALGTGAYYNYNRSRCWIEIQDLFDRRGRYLGTQNVEVCQ